VLGGPLVPVGEQGEAPYEDSSKWIELGFPKLIAMRLSLTRLMTPFNVRTQRNTGLLGRVQEVALATRPVDLEARITSIVNPKPSFSFYTAPMGPSARLESIVHVSNPSVARPVEKIVGDRDLAANQAILMLWRSGVTVDHTVRLLSMGLLGSRRKLVPTRWSITAVDDAVSKGLLGEIRSMPKLDVTLAGFHRVLGNSFGVLLIGSTSWSFEMLESWAPYVGASNNQWYIVPSDSEPHSGRTKYASNLGGAYYAARLAVAHRLHRMGRQARALVLMEVDREWLAPLGVWRVREGVKLAADTASEFEDPKKAVEHLLAKMATNRLSWIRSSLTLSGLYLNRTLDEFILK
jgi:hypothetical protein